MTARACVLCIQTCVIATTFTVRIVARAMGGVAINKKQHGGRKEVATGGGTLTITIPV